MQHYLRKIAPLMLVGLSMPGYAQVNDDDIPDIYPVDERGISIINARPTLQSEIFSIGRDSRQLIFRRKLEKKGANQQWTHNHNSEEEGDQIQLDGTTYVFDGNKKSDLGSTLVIQSNPSRSILTTGNGTVAVYNHITMPGSTDVSRRLSSVTYPNGIQHHYSYEHTTICVGGGSLLCTVNIYSRPTIVDTNVGLKLHIRYATPLSLINSANLHKLHEISKVQLINSAQMLCGYTTDECALSENGGPIAINVSYSQDNPNPPNELFEYENASDISGVIIKYTFGRTYNSPTARYEGRLLRKIENLGASLNNAINYTYGGSGYRTSVSSVSIGSDVWNYEYDNQPSSDEKEVTRTNPDLSERTFNTEFSSSGDVEEQDVSDELNRETLFSYTSDGFRIRRISLPAGNKVEFTYDLRGNKLTETRTPTSGLGGPILVRSWGYDSACSNRITCNLPRWARDEKMNQTDYSYDSQHGGMLSETRPAGVDGVRPVRRFGYVQRYAWIKATSGGYAQASSPIWLLSEERSCRTTATIGNTCAGGPSDELVTTYDYGPASGPNNLWLRGKVEVADGVSSRTCYGYDMNGYQIWETKPGAGVTACY